MPRGAIRAPGLPSPGPQTPRSGDAGLPAAARQVVQTGVKVRCGGGAVEQDATPRLWSKIADRRGSLPAPPTYDTSAADSACPKTHTPRKASLVSVSR